MKHLAFLKAGLFILTGLFSRQSALASGISPKKIPMDVPELLKKWSEIPDLTFIARDLAKDGDVGPVMAKLEKDYRRSETVFLVTTLFRETEKCPKGDHEIGKATIMIVNGKGESFGTSRMEWHGIESHSAEVSPELAAFFRTLPLRIASLTPDTKMLLDRWNALPDLHSIAYDQVGFKDHGNALEKLETQFRIDQRPFQVITVYRGIENCAAGEHHVGMSKHRIVNESGASIEIRGRIQHDFEVHSIPFPPDLADFLRKLPDSSRALP